MEISEKDYIDMKVDMEGKLRASEVMRIEEVATARFEGLREATKIYNETMHEWKIGHNEWKARMEELTKNTVTRREAWIFLIAVGTFFLTIITILVSISSKIKIQ